MVRPICIVLVVSVVMLTFIGLVMVYSASSASLASSGQSAFSGIVSQLLYAVVGIACGIVVWFVPYRIWVGRAVWIVWLIALLLIIATAVFGVGAEEVGASRWLDIGPISIQPSEFIKIALLLMAVRLVHDVHEGEIGFLVGIGMALIFVVLPLVLLYWTQSDLGTTLVIAVGILAVMCLGGVSWRVIVPIVIVGVVFAVVAIVGTGYRSDRLVFLDPWNDGEGGYGNGYQIIRAFYAFAEGGIFGVGLGNSHEKYQYLPASDTDYIFAVIGEELGLVGALLVIGLFLVVLYTGLRLAQFASDDFGYMIAGGCAIMLVFQAFLNIGCSIGVLPTTGKPLPFISSGGSSLIASMIMVGLVLSVARETLRPDVYEQRRADLRIVRVQEGRSSRGSEDADDGYDDGSTRGYSGSGRRLGFLGSYFGRDAGRDSGRGTERSSRRGSGRDAERSSRRGFGRDAERSSGRTSGRDSGRDAERSSGRTSGRGSGRSSRRGAGRDSGRDAGRGSGRTSGRGSGRISGRTSGRNSGRTSERGSGRSTREEGRLSAQRRLSDSRR